MSSTGVRPGGAPVAGYDVALLDLDGVVYIGPDAVPGVPEALARCRTAGMQLAFVTNNAARPPETVAAHLTELGIEAAPGEVITSAQSAARYLAERLPAAAQVLVLGTTGLLEALRERGLTPVDTAGPDVAAVVQGYSPDMNWRSLAEGAVAINAGVLWVATNVDPTVPSPRGPLPGNGSLVLALRHATRHDPVVTGKPDPFMHRETVLRTGAQRPIVVGDRLDTDIEGANAVGCASLLVLSGVTDVRDLLAATPEQRPTLIGRDAGALLITHPDVTVDGDTARCGRWSATVGEGALGLTRTDGAAGAGATGAGAAGDGSSPDGADDDLDAVRALSAAAWASGHGGELAVRAGTPEAVGVLERWGLASGS